MSTQQFLIKMVKAGQLQYEAIKELLPPAWNKALEELEAELVRFGGELAKEWLKEKVQESRTATHEAKVTRVDIDFTENKE